VLSVRADGAILALGRCTEIRHKFARLLDSPPAWWRHREQCLLELTVSGEIAVVDYSGRVWDSAATIGRPSSAPAGGIEGVEDHNHCFAPAAWIDVAGPRAKILRIGEADRPHIAVNALASVGCRLDCEESRRRPPSRRSGQQ
jgi:hypothetical protein